MVPSPGAPDRVDGARSRAEAQWTRYLERVREGEDLDLREYCEEAPELARSLFDGDADGTFLDRLLEEVSTPSPPSPTELPPSGARYEIRGELARGAMGSILRAFDPNLDRELAMKVILDDEDGSRARALLPRFLQEARVTGQLEHPGIVPVHELGLDGEGRVYFTMPRIEGTDLSTILRRCRDGNGEWPLTRVLGLLSRATDALAFAHSRGVVHRDLKPANIRVGSFGETYVMDWGLAKVLREEGAPEESELPESAFDLGPLHTRVGSVIGTPHYMPPEQAAGDQESIDARTDVYAMGAILYELLTGRPPYGDDDARAEAVIEEVLRGPPAPIGTGGRRVPAELASIAERAMARDPALRDRSGAMGAHRSGRGAPRVGASQPRDRREPPGAPARLPRGSPPLAGGRGGEVPSDPPARGHSAPAGSDRGGAGARSALPRPRAPLRGLRARAPRAAAGETGPPPSGPRGAAGDGPPRHGGGDRASAR